MTWGKSNIGKKIFPHVQIWNFFCWYRLLCAATKEKRLIYCVQRWLQCLQQACTNLVSTKRVLDAILWLKDSNPYYKDITINHAALQQFSTPVQLEQMLI